MRTTCTCRFLLCFYINLIDFLQRKDSKEKESWSIDSVHVHSILEGISVSLVITITTIRQCSTETARAPVSCFDVTQESRLRKFDCHFCFFWRFDVYSRSVASDFSSSRSLYFQQKSDYMHALGIGRRCHWSKRFYSFPSNNFGDKWHLRNFSTRPRRPRGRRVRYLRRKRCQGDSPEKQQVYKVNSNYVSDILY